MIQSSTNLGVAVKIFCRCGLFQSPSGDYHMLSGLSTSALELCYLRFGPWANNINISWGLVGHSDLLPLNLLYKLPRGFRGTVKNEVNLHPRRAAQPTLAPNP